MASGSSLQSIGGDRAGGGLSGPSSLRELEESMDDNSPDPGSQPQMELSEIAAVLETRAVDGELSGEITTERNVEQMAPLVGSDSSTVGQQTSTILWDDNGGLTL